MSRSQLRRTEFCRASALGGGRMGADGGEVAQGMGGKPGAASVLREERGSGSKDGHHNQGP